MNPGRIDARPASPGDRRPAAAAFSPTLSLLLSLALSLALFLALSLAAPSLHAEDGSKGSGADPAQQPSPMEALGALLGAIQGGQDQNRAPVDREQIRALLPDSAAGERRTRIKSGVNQIPGFSGGYAEADYGSGARKMTVKISDMGSIGAMAASFGQISEEETDTRVERNWREDGNYHQQKADTGRKTVDYTINFGSGLVLEVDARGFSLDEVKGAVDGIGVGRIMALTEPRT